MDEQGIHASLMFPTLASAVEERMIRALLREMGARVGRLELAGEAQIHASFVVGLKTLPVRYTIRPR